jgi:MOSC domain-containing protein YiiM
MRLISINIGKERTQQRKHYIETTGIYKMPVDGPVEIKSLGIEDDAICDKENHGGPDQAIYVYGGADYTWWSRKLGKELVPGIFGDNLTIGELESPLFSIGDYLHIGEVILQVTSPRIPCGTFATRMQDPQWVKKFRAAERPGLYCRVIQEGIVKAGDSVFVEPYAGATISIVESYRFYYEPDKTEEMIRRHLEAPIDIRGRKDLEQKLLALQTTADA